MKKILALLLSALMVMTMVPFQVFAAPVCDHLLTVTNWSSLPADFKTAHPEMEPADSEHPVASFMSVKVPAEACEKDGWQINRSDNSGFCILCGKFFVDGHEIVVDDPNNSPVSQGATVVPGVEHHWVTDVPATCENKGLDKCDNVNKILNVTYAGGIYSASLTDVPCTVTQQTNALGHDYVGTVTTEPTCETAGVKTFVCQNDTSHTYTEPIPATGHDWDDGTVTTAPTCETAGVKTFVCKNDPTHTYTEPITATGHTMVAQTPVAPTCTTDGYTMYKCSVCGFEEKRDVIPALTHNWALIETQAANCTVDGYKKYECTRCGATKTETLTALGHNVTDWTVVLPEACEVDGVKKGVCTNTGCGKEVFEVIPGTPHIYTLEDTVAPTCEQAGYKLYVCHNYNKRTAAECGASYKEPIAATGHTWVTQTPIAATCTESGKDYQLCSVCGAENLLTYYAPLGHDVTDTVVDPTCTEQGYTRHVCSRGDLDYNDTYVPALGHQWDAGVETIAPTCTTEGVKTYTCTRPVSAGTTCGATKTEPIPMLPHTWTVSEMVYPTCTEDGYRAWVCSACGTASFIEPLPATGHHNPNADGTFDEYANCVHGNVYYCDNVNKNLDPSDPNYVCGARVEDNARDYSCELVPDPVYASLEKLDVPAGAEEDAAYRIIFKDYDENIYVNYTQAEIVSAMIAHTGHNYDITYVKATCEMDGYWLLKCTNGCPTLDADGNVLETPDGVLDTEEKVLAENEIIKIINANTALGHNWALLDDGSAKQPTCTEDGYRHYMCLNDHAHTYTEKLPATGHTYTYKEYVEADCTHGGYKLYACDVCGAETKEYITDKLPHNYVVTNTVAATCTTEGYEVYTCNVCDASYTNVTTPALGHNYVVKSHVNATCTTPGYDVYGCTRCNAPTYNVTTEQALGHNYVVKNHINATCTAPGYDVYSCSRCNDTYNVTAEQAKGHDYRYVADKSQAATCGKDGYRFYECAASGCDASKTEVIPATGAHKYTRTTVAATCTTEGYEVYTCDVCHASYTNVTTPAKGHHYVVVDKTPATCTAQGYDTYECVDCGKSYTETTTSALGHDYVVKSHVDATCTTEGYDVYGCSRCDADTYKVSTQPVIAHDWVEAGYAQKIDKDGNLVVNDDGEPVYDVPDCGNDGTMLYECTMCHDTRTEVVPATGDHAFTETVVTAATCTEDGTMDHVCEVCGYAYSTVIPATGHSMLYTETPATCTENGKMVAKCANCDYTETYVIPATGHTYDTKGVYTPSTCVEDGYTTYTCTVCKKASVTKTEDKAAGHVFKASVTNPATLNADGTITTACIHCGKATAKTIPGIKSITLNTTSYVYTGKACRPGVTIIDSEGNVITSANYELTYENNKKIGKASVTIKFKGNYAGTVKKSFKIVPKNVGISDISTSKGQIRFTWGKVANCDGYQIQYSTSKTFKSKKTITVKSRKTCTQVLDNLKSGKKYSIRIRAYKVVDGKKIYGNWSTTTKKCK